MALSLLVVTVWMIGFVRLATGAKRIRTAGPTYSGDTLMARDRGPTQIEWAAPLRNRWFADSPLEVGVSCELVSEKAKIPC
jgi:hypothetical protein